MAATWARSTGRSALCTLFLALRDWCSMNDLLLAVPLSENGLRRWLTTLVEAGLVQRDKPAHPFHPIRYRWRNSPAVAHPTPPEAP